MPTDNLYILDISLTRWIVAIGVAAGLFALLLLVRRVLAARLQKFAAHTKTSVDDLLVLAIRKTRGITLLAASVWPALQILEVPASVRSVAWGATVIIGGFQLATWGDLIITSVLAHRVLRLQSEDPESATTLTGLTFLVRCVLWVVLVLLALDNLGVNITSLVAGLGIGGVAVALATQNILGDLFASLSIVLDKPFVVGDFIVVGDLSGTVEHIGLKTTRLRSISGEQLVFANSDLLQSRVHNYKRMNERRIAFTFGVTYQASADQLTQIPGMLKAVLEKEEGIRFDRAHLKSFDAGQVTFEVVYIVNDADYNHYMDIQQNINLAIYRKLEEEGVDFAGPYLPGPLRNAALAALKEKTEAAQS